jgi:hypothetical protein
LRDGLDLHRRLSESELACDPAPEPERVCDLAGFGIDGNVAAASLDDAVVDDPQGVGYADEPRLARTFARARDIFDACPFRWMRPCGFVPALLGSGE